MTNSHSSSLLATSGCQASILSRQIGILGPACRKGGFNQELAEPGTAFGGLATCAFARTLVIARTHASPRCQMLRTFKPIHVGADFCEDPLGSTLTDTRNATKQN